MAYGSNWMVSGNEARSPYGGGGAGFSPQTMYSAASKQQAGDYDEIMQRYRTLGQQIPRATQMQYTPLQGAYRQFQGGMTPTYQRSPEFNTAANTASDFARTGGMTQEDINNIRARGISPIRAVYGNAQRNVDRQRSLQGGYSPNYNAVTAKMAREQSSLLSDKVGDVNAGIAEMVAKNKMSGVSALSPLALAESGFNSAAQGRDREERMAIDAYNTEQQNRINQMNMQNQMAVNQANQQSVQQAFQNAAGVNQGMTSLYGTTPALAATFGQQALAERGQNIQQASNIAQTYNNRGQLGGGVVNNLQQSGYGRYPEGYTRLG
jgi:hypothetical protein